MLKKAIPYLLSIIFVFSAISKLITVEYFQQFIYSFGFLTDNLAIVFSRLLIASELIIGILFLFRKKIKILSYLTLCLMIGFTCFILYLEFWNIADDCHCFGDLFHVSNTVSIIKNIIIIALVTIVLRNYKALEASKFELKFILPSTVIVALAVSFCVYFPFNLKNESSGDVKYCESCIEDIVVENDLKNDRKIFCFLSTKCEYCKLAAQKISVMAEKANNYDDIHYFMWIHEDDNMDKFYKETNTHSFEYTELNVLSFLKITEGIMPLIIIYDKGNITPLRYNTLDEKVVLNFLKEK